MKDAEGILDSSGSQQTRVNWPSLETITKSLGLSAILFYALGLVVQNVYLATLGLSDFDLLKAKSILTGILCAVLLAAAAIPTLLAYAVAFLPGVDATPKKRQIAAWVLVGCMSIGAFFVLRRYFEPDLSSWKPYEIEWLVSTRFWAAAMVYVSLLSSAVFLVTAKRRASPKERVEELRSIVVVSSVFAIFALPGVYPAFPAHFGGGRPISVCLILTDDGRKVWHNLSTKYDDSQDPFVQLVWEREKTLLVRANTHFDKKFSNTVVVLDRALVQAFIPMPGEYDPHE